MPTIQPFDLSRSNNSLQSTNKDGSKVVYPIGYFENLMANNKIFSRDRARVYNKFSRHGYIPIHDTEQVLREYLFFTKPDLNLFGEDIAGDIISYSAELNSTLKTISLFTEAEKRNSNALKQLQYSVVDYDGIRNPFMYLLSNNVTSKLDLPGISADSRETTSTIMGTSIQYRGHSLKSDNGYDFTLSFRDSSYLEIYTLLKVYDEYIRLIKTGEHQPKYRHINNKIISDQFSIYKFLIADDGETILYYAKLTGCYFTDVPRSDLSDPGPDGFKYSVSFHAQFVEDSNPLILSEFNRVSPGSRKGTDFANVYDFNNSVVDNTWVRWPVIVSVDKNTDLQVERRGTVRDYRLKWIRR